MTDAIHTRPGPDPAATAPGETGQLLDRVEPGVFRDQVSRLEPDLARVLTLVGQGLTDAQICAALNLSRRAVQYRITAIVRALGVRNRNALIARLAIENLA